MQRFFAVLVLAGVLLAEAPPAALFEGLGPHRRKVTTESEQAQRYFDQGLVWAFAFNHDEAIRSFEEAARLDPNLAMAWWGVALCHGPHINNPALPEERAKLAWDALQKALALREKASTVERALVDALAKRYADPPPQDRAALDRAYADAMREVWLVHRGDPDIGTLYAEALMDLQPWDLWTKDGKPKGRTEEILATLEEVLKRAPDHPGANHLYIHATEASPFPEKGVPSADRLRTQTPIAGHLLHMPAHIDVQVGAWAKASAANVAAIEADRRYRKISPQQDFYRVYMAHNHHFLSFASMMQGRSATAIGAARDMLAGIPQEYAEKNAAVVDGYTLIVLEALMRFGRWDELLLEPEPPAYFPIHAAYRKFARAVAYGAKGDLESAEKERAAFLEARAKVPEGAMMAINPAADVLTIAGLVLDGELAFRRGDLEAAVKFLREACAIEDRLRYMEPPDWMQPVRHTLGAVLVSAGRFEEAEEVYREDLQAWPENGWSLFGLATCLEARGEAGEASEVRKRFDAVWANADVEIGSTCLCVPPAR